MAALKKAFNGTNLPALVLKIMKGAHEPMPSGYGNDLIGLIQDSLKLDPEKRPESRDIIGIPFIQSFLVEAQVVVGRVDSMFLT